MRQSGLGGPSPPMDAAVGVDWAWPWARPWVPAACAVVGVAVGVDTAASAAPQPPYPACGALWIYE
jgi:hypothetical protein